MELYELDDYRQAIKIRFKEVQIRRPALTWRRLAAEIQVQYTYLSKVLNSETSHLNEDHVFLICRALEFFPEEIEFISLLRQYAVARDSEHKDHLNRRIRELQRTKSLSASKATLSSTSLDHQIRYLFEPLCQIVHMALDIPDFRKDPRRLCGLLSIHLTQLREILRILSQNDFIELEEDGLTLRKIRPTKIHFGPDHPLMRYHVNIIKNQLIARLNSTQEKDKKNFLVTFTADENSYHEIKNEFQSFLKKIERIASESRDEHVYQLSFDLLKWL
jgi:uncharacterized protein (TIGR02147 family)